VGENVRLGRVAGIPVGMNWSLLVVYRFSAFPLRGPDGRLEGLVTLSRLKAVPPERRVSTTVGDIACPMSDVPVAVPEEPIVDLLGRMTEATDGRALVLVDGQLVGLVSPTDISRTVSLAALRPSRYGRVAGGSRLRVLPTADKAAQAMSGSPQRRRIAMRAARSSSTAAFQSVAAGRSGSVTMTCTAPRRTNR
jgi:hypothetical protein